MRSSTLFDRFSRAFHDHPSLSKLLVVFTVRYLLCFPAPRELAFVFSLYLHLAPFMGVCELGRFGSDVVSWAERVGRRRDFRAVLSTGGFVCGSLFYGQEAKSRSCLLPRNIRCSLGLV